MTSFSKCMAAGSHQQTWQQIQNEQWQMVVVGGGITGAGIALEAARQGLKVLLLEKHDFAWGTSSRSSKMVHGGLRYMAAGDIKTTRDSVRERERLLTEAPGLVDLMTYAMPHYKKQFPTPFIFNALLWVYDLFAAKKYRKFIKPKEFLERYPLLKSEEFLGATLFADAVTDDSRLVMRVLHEAVHAGACCINYVGADKVLVESGQAVGLSLTNQLTQESVKLSAEVVVNATGVWVDELRKQLVNESKIRPSRGSHIVLSAERLPVFDSLTILHPDDKRPIFIYPWLGRTVVGTTDIDEGKVKQGEAEISHKELDYLLKLVQYYFAAAEIVKEDIIATFSGVRPLIDSGALSPSKEKRTHSVWENKGLVSVSGGKLTTFRLIAQDAIKAAEKHIKEFHLQAFSEHVFFPSDNNSVQSDSLSAATIKRLQGFYGFQYPSVMATINDKQEQEIADAALVWGELRWIAANESVQHLDDLLLRRTRVGLLLEQGGLEFEAEIKDICEQELGWSAQQWQQEVERYKAILVVHYRLPTD